MQITNANLDLCYFNVHNVIRNYDSFCFFVLISVHRCFYLHVFVFPKSWSVSTSLEAFYLWGYHCKVPTSHDYVLVHHQWAASAINTNIFTLICIPYFIYVYILCMLFVACFGGPLCF